MYKVHTYTHKYIDTYTYTYFHMYIHLYQMYKHILYCNIYICNIEKHIFDDFFDVLQMKINY